MAQQTETVIENICNLLATGESLLDICKLPDMPSRPALYVWMAGDEALKTRIARARELGQDAEIERTVAMADAATPEDYNAVKLRIWARQWRASKIAPHRYGDRVTLAGDANAPIRVDLSALSDLELEQAEALSRRITSQVLEPKLLEAKSEPPI